MPILILSPEEKVSEMLAGTSHDPDEVLGHMVPFNGEFEDWTCTVTTAAVNAVMAGCKEARVKIKEIYVPGTDLFKNLTQHSTFTIW